MLESGISCIGGRVELYTSTKKATYWDLHSMRGLFPVKENIKQSNFTPTCNLFVKKSVVKRVGIFDTRLVSSGDLEFGQRVKYAGIKQGYAEKAVIYHPTRSTLQEYVKWAFRIGRGKAQLARYYPKRYKKAIYGFYSPKKYLPPAPWKFDGKIKGYKAMSLSQKCRIYILTYIKNVCLPLGVLAGIFTEFIFRKDLFCNSGSKNDKL
jgi:GT2 family glycosyltransferase